MMIDNLEMQFIEAKIFMQWLMGNSKGMLRTRFLLVLLGVLVIVVQPGCLSVIKPVDVELSNQQLPFVRDGTTTMDEVTARMGEPASIYENGRVFIYGLCKENEQLRSGNTCVGNHNYNLVLVFGSDGILERHSLVEKN
jgi:hypothetical protein